MTTPAQSNQMSAAALVKIAANSPKSTAPVDGTLVVFAYGEGRARPVRSTPTHDYIDAITGAVYSRRNEGSNNAFYAIINDTDIAAFAF